MRKHRMLLATLAVLLVLGTLFAAAVSAQGPATPPNDDDGDGVCDTCGLERGGALGRMMGRGVGRGFGMGIAGGGGMMGFFADDTLVDVVAEVTDQSVEDVQAALAEGQTLEEVITGAGSTVDAVVDEFIARRQAVLAELVADGRLTQEQADAMLAHMEEEVAEHIEEGLPNCPNGGLGGFGRGRGMMGLRGGGTRLGLGI